MRRLFLAGCTIYHRFCRALVQIRKEDCIYPKQSDQIAWANRIDPKEFDPGLKWLPSHQNILETSLDMFKFCKYFYALTLAMLNKLRCHAHFLFSANQITSSRLLLQIHILNDKQCRSRSVGFLNQLMWIYTVCKVRHIWVQQDQGCLFVLRFYGPVNPMGSCRARSVYLTTRLLGRLSPLSG